MKIQNPTDVQRLAVDSFRTFLDSEIAPIVLTFRGGPMPREKMREITEGIAEFGLPGASIAPVHGGMGLSVITEAMLLEELCVISSEIAHCVIGNMLVANLLVNLPATGEALRERYLPDLLAGRSFGGYYLCEADAHASGLEGNIDAWPSAGGWVVNGAHERVHNGHYSDFVIAEARTEDGQLCHVLVEREQHGYTSQIINRATQAGTLYSRVSFQNVRLPAGHLIREEQGGLLQQTGLLVKIDASAALICIGLMRAVLEHCIAAAQARDGTEKPAASQPLVALKVAEMATRLEAARLMCFRAYSLIDAGSDCQMQACMARWLASEMVLGACQAALQLPGGKKLGAVLDLERLVREAILLPAPHGLTDAQKLSIARALTGVSAPG